MSGTRCFLVRGSAVLITLTIFVALGALLTLNSTHCSERWRLQGPPSPTYGGEQGLERVNLMHNPSHRRSHRLDRFAREFGAYVKRTGRSPDPSLRAALLEASGASVWSPRVWVWRTEGGELTPQQLKERRALVFAQRPSDDLKAPLLWGEWREPSSSGESSLHVMVSAPELVRLMSVNRAISDEPQEPTRLSFDVHKNLRAPEALISIDHQHPHPLEVKTLNISPETSPKAGSKARYEVILPSLGEGVVEVEVELLARGAYGLRPLCQLSLIKGARISHLTASRLTASYQMLQSERAEDRAEEERASLRGARTLLTWVNEERRARNLLPLTLSPHLSALAREHTQEMLTLHYRGHRSPTSGEPADRLKRSGYVALESAENITEQPTLRAAHEALMQSLGHRRSLLDPSFTHAGFSTQRGAQGWLVTQFMTKPAPHYTADDLPYLAQALQRKTPNAFALISAQTKYTLLPPTKHTQEAQIIKQREEREQSEDNVRHSLSQSFIHLQETLDSGRGELAEVQPDQLIESARAQGLTGRLSAWVTESATLEGLMSPQQAHDLNGARVVLFTLNIKPSKQQGGWPTLILWLYVWRPLSTDEGSMKRERGG